MVKLPNLYGDFNAGFILYNPDGGGTFKPFLPVLRKYAEQFMLSTDTDYSISEAKAIEAMYRVFDHLNDPIVGKGIANGNLMKLFEAQPATNTQMEKLLKLKPNRDWPKLTKLGGGTSLGIGQRRISPGF